MQGSVLVVKASKNIKYKEKIEPSYVHLEYINNLKRSCSLVTKDDIDKKIYRAKVFLKKGRVICKKDIYIAQKNRLIFNFGSIEIEKDGKLIKETKDYLRIRNIDGKIDKLYKDGRQR
jgi:hypothetical protein